MSREESSFGYLHCLTTTFRGLVVLVSEPVQSSSKPTHQITSSSQSLIDKTGDRTAPDELCRSFSRATTCASLEEHGNDEDTLCISETMLRAVSAARGMNHSENTGNYSGE